MAQAKEKQFLRAAYLIMNLIQKLESDVSQAAEYGGLPNFYSRTELRKIIAALKSGEELSSCLKNAYNYLGTPWREQQTPMIKKAQETWETLINS